MNKNNQVSLTRKAGPWHTSLSLTRLAIWEIHSSSYQRIVQITMYLGKVPAQTTFSNTLTPKIRTYNKHEEWVTTIHPQFKAEMAFRLTSQWTWFLVKIVEIALWIIDKITSISQALPYRHKQAWIENREIKSKWARTWVPKKKQSRARWLTRPHLRITRDMCKFRTITNPYTIKVNSTISKASSICNQAQIQVLLGEVDRELIRHQGQRRDPCLTR